MPSPQRDPLDPLAGPSSPDAAGRATPYGPQPHGVDKAAGGADSSPLDNQSTDAAEPAAERLRTEGRRPESDPAHR